MLLILNVLSVTLIINKLSTLPKNYKFFKRDYSKLDSEALVVKLEPLMSIQSFTIFMIALLKLLISMLLFVNFLERKLSPYLSRG